MNLYLQTNDRPSVFSQIPCFLLLFSEIRTKGEREKESVCVCQAR